MSGEIPTTGTLHESAHKTDAFAAEQPPPREIAVARPAPRRRSLNEAAHKLGHWRAARESDDRRASEAARARFAALADADRDVVARSGRAVLALGAMGVVYGDIGTSPLYAEQAIFRSYGATTHVTPATVYGVVSLIFWALTIVVSIKYAGFIMRAHNRGDGGILALTALLGRHRVPHAGVFLMLGVFGAALFFGDGVITPSISVLGALQGLEVTDPVLAKLVVPLAVGVLIALFFVQRYGSATMGWLFGPVIVVWFVVIGLVGLGEVVRHPGVLQGLSPVWGMRFLLDHGAGGYLVLGGVVLAVTGAEALYADRGHFGAAPIRLGWFGLAFPALTLNYLGQSALILHRPGAAADPFFLLAPGWSRYPLLILATVATIIASQAVITGSFSVARQAVQLGFLPRLRLVHTSDTEGQIYVPVVNWGLCAGVVVLTLAFGSAGRLGDVYGVAVTGTFVLNTVLFGAVARHLWGTPWRRLAPIAGLFLLVEATFFTANAAKVAHGAWLPLVVGLVLALVMANWRRGQVVVTRNRVAREGSLEAFLAGLADRRPPVVRVPGVAVFLNPTKETTPLALRSEVEHSHALHERVLIVSVDSVSVPQVDECDRFVVERLGKGTFRATHVTVRAGYREKTDVPEALRLCRKLGLLERNLDLEHASYFLSRIAIHPAGGPPLRRWRARLFVAMARNAASPIDAFKLPSERTVLVGSPIAL